MLISSGGGTAGGWASCPRKVLTTGASHFGWGSKFGIKADYLVSCGIRFLCKPRMAQQSRQFLDIRLILALEGEGAHRKNWSDAQLFFVISSENSFHCRCLRHLIWNALTMRTPEDSFDDNSSQWRLLLEIAPSVILISAALSPREGMLSMYLDDHNVRAKGRGQEEMKNRMRQVRLNQKTLFYGLLSASSAPWMEAFRSLSPRPPPTHTHTFTPSFHDIWNYQTEFWALNALRQPCTRNLHEFTE